MKLSAFLTAIAILLSIGLVHADGTNAPLRTLSVTGTGSVQAAPDMADITIGVTTIAPTARAALSANNEQTSKVFEFLKSAGVAGEDMQSTNLSVSPQYRNHRPSEVRQQPEIIGYMVNNSLRAAVRKLDSFGRILDGVVTAGANNVNGIRFDVSEREALTRMATANAVKDALAQAANIAEAAGVKLGPIQTINLSGGYRPPQPYLARAESSAVPVAAGELSISSSASIVFTIE